MSAILSLGHRGSPKKAFLGERGNTPKRMFKDDDCFGNLNEEELSKDFDFEENLALFDKKVHDNDQW